MLKIKLIFLIGLFSFTAFAKGGDVGNGGTGLKCEENIYILEEYHLNKAGGKLDKFNSLNDLIFLVRKKLNGNKKLLDQFDISRKLIGHPDKWTTAELYQTYDSYQFSSFYEINEKKIYCEVIQLAKQIDDIVTLNLIYKDQLSAKQRMILWLHEVFYNIGVKHYSHKNSSLVQKLVTSIINLKEKRVRTKLVIEFTNNFINYPLKELKTISNHSKKRGHYNWFNSRTHYSDGFYRVTNGNYMNFKGCPSALSLDYNGDKGLVIGFLMASDNDTIESPYTMQQKNIEKKLEIFNLNFNEKVIFSQNKLKTHRIEMKLYKSFDRQKILLITQENLQNKTIKVFGLKHESNHFSSNRFFYYMEYNSSKFRKISKRKLLNDIFSNSIMCGYNQTRIGDFRSLLLRFNEGTWVVK